MTSVHVCMACVEAVSDDEGCVQRSRHSGRLLLPPLAFWAGQRVIVSHKPGTANQYIQGRDVLVDSQSAAVSFSQVTHTHCNS